MDVQQILGQVKDAATVRRVFGEPIERDGVTVIPVARVAGGAGGGMGQGTGSEANSGSGSGAGYGMGAAPVGVYVIKDGQVTFQPALDLNRVILGGQIAAVVLALVARSIVRSVIRARRGR
jgi:uncharacterized spore protein YtfJ